MNNANIDVLAERVDSFLQQSAEVKGMIQGISSGQQSLVSQIAVFQERMAQVHLTQQRLNNILDQQGEEIDRVREEQKRASEKISDEQKRMSEEVGKQGQLWKLFGSVTLFLATAALGLAGWLNNTVGITERRIGLVEYAMGMRNIIPQPSSQPVSK